MPAESRPLARQLLRVVLGTPDVPDGDLLARFVNARDEEAFAEIVRRHGPMVLGVCRRVTGRAHDADDAFQATFLVLARRAGHVARPELLANYLYGIACRTALEARARRRRAEERLVPAAPEPAAPPAPDDTAELRQVIDEELARLPDKYRAAVVLCELEGVSRAAAAAQLGIPEGTLSSRLAHARKVLAERLSRRGVTVGVSAVGAALSADATATVVAHTLTHTTVYAAVRFVPGAGFPPGVSATVSSLTDGVLKAMFVTRLKHLFGLGLLACGVIGLGAALAQQPLPAPVPDAPLTPPTVAADPALALPLLAQQPKAAEPKKVAAKGIEDDDVPYGSFPSQAVVRVEDGKLIVRQRQQIYEPVAQKRDDNTTVVSYQMKSGVTARTYDPADITVFDMKGNRLAAKDWKGQLKSDVHALVAADGKLPNPRELTLFKADTLLIVLPAAPTPVAPSIYAPAAGGQGGVYTLPAAPPAPTPAPVAPRVAPPIRPAAPAAVPAPAPLPDHVRGTVTKVVGGFVEISVGQDAGLEVGSKLDVYRTAGDGKYLGTLVVATLSGAKGAVCEFKPARQVALDQLRDEELPRKGDTVGQVTATPRVAPPVRPAAPAAPPTVNGAVLEVNGDAVAIGVGRDAGLKVGSKLGVVRPREDEPSRFLGELTITKVDAKTATGTFAALRNGIPLDKLDADELPRPGDTAYFAANPIP
jgi:RNA polymerase sigma factor (sigma-70 family)